MYAVAGSSNLGTGIYHYDGSEWTEYFDRAYMHRLRVLPSGEVIAIGDTVMQKGEGNKWTNLGLPGDATLADDAFGPNVASLFLAAGQVYVRKGKGWNAVPAFTTAITGTFLGVPDATFLLSATRSRVDLLKTTDGAKWDKAVENIPADYRQKSSERIFGSSSADVWFIAYGSDLQHYDATALTKVEAPGGSWGCDLRGGFATSKKNAWVYGTAGCTFHWDGAVWTKVPTGATEAITAIHGSSPEDVWAVPLSET